MRDYRSFDYALALEYCQNPRTLTRVARKFVQDLEQDITVLRESITATRSEEVAAVAHRIKGASATLAAHEIHSIAKDLEQVARAGGPSEMSSVDRLATAFDLYRSDVAALEEA